MSGSVMSIDFVAAADFAYFGVPKQLLSKNVMMNL